MRFKCAREDWERVGTQTSGRGSNWRAETPSARANEVHPPKILEAPGERGRVCGQTRFKPTRELSGRSAGCARAASRPKRELRLLLKVTMADQSEINLGVGVAPTVVEHEGSKRKGRGKSREPSRAREDFREQGRTWET
ncbi:hypothetical protein GH714_019184 [Hevea brasiliensis]|uniref:Uncharacterized protein n=1 Tax=Hevea brasiliensis TaxID=3981 RepID=A0A6A6KN42_HEVBR|nr:hypothetical protein GH714_019184 [Hevea brasiliensis]